MNPSVATSSLAMRSTKGCLQLTYAINQGLTPPYPHFAVLVSPPVVFLYDHSKLSL